MKTNRLIAPLVALGFTLAASATDKPVSEKDRASIAELMSKHDAALRAGDPRELLTLANDDYIELGAGLPAQGKEGTLKMLDDFFANNEAPTFKTAIRDIKVTGDWAVVRADSEQLIRKKSDGSALEIQGKQLLLLHREKDGNWKIQTNMWNLSGPPKPVK